MLLVLELCTGQALDVVLNWKRLTAWRFWGVILFYFA